MNNFGNSLEVYGYQSQISRSDDLNAIPICLLGAGASSCLFVLDAVCMVFRSLYQGCWCVQMSREVVDSGVMVDQKGQKSTSGRPTYSYQAAASPVL